MESKNRIKIVTGMVSLIIIIACIVFYAQPSGLKSVHSGRREAPSFHLADHLGHVHTLEDARGKIVLVHFWASWCPPCLQEIPDLLDFANQWAKEGNGKPIQIFAISLDDKWENAEKILDTAKLPKNFTSLLDLSTKVPDAYGTYQYPETYLIDGEGRIIAKWIGAQPWSSPGMQKVLEEAVRQLKPE
jgi:cytochrome c biogenesis protein CcmG/thiol:disulfide interchange protein DsbE